MSQPPPSEPNCTVNTDGGAYNEGTINNTGMVNVSGGQTGNITVISQPPRQICPQPPPAPDKFAGRDEELARLKERLKAGEVEAVAVMNGLGGIGKTALARQLAHVLYHETGSERYFRAVLWLDVTSLPDESRLLRELAGQVEPEFRLYEGEGLAGLRQRVRASLQTAIEQKCAECGPDRVLFVLDDVWENGLAVAKRLKELRPANTTVLVTTRFGKVAQELYAQPITLNRFQPSEGAKMLAAYLPDVADKGLLQSLSTVLGGHALALKLAAYRVPRLNPLKALQTQLEQYLIRLADGTHFWDLELADKETDLEKVLSYTYTDLGETGQAHFRALGVLPAEQPFDKELLAAVWRISEAEVESEIERFYDLALLEPSTEEESAVSYGPGWYRQHTILNSYALALLKVNPTEYAATRDRYHDRSIRIAYGFRELKDKPEEWQPLDPYLPHIHSVGDVLAALTLTNPPTHDEPTLSRALDFARYITVYLYRRQEVHKMKWLEMGLVAARSLQDRPRESLFLNSLGLYYDNRGDKAKALDYYKQDLVISREIDDQQGEAATLSNIGLVYSSLGDQQQALDFYQQALLLLRAVGDQSGAATTLTNIGLAYSDLGDKRQALAFYQQTLFLTRAVGDRGGEAATLTNIGKVYSDLGDKRQALQYYEQALPLTRAVGDRRGEANTLSNMGIVLWEIGEQERGLQLVEQAQSLLEQIRSPNAQVVAGYVAQLRAALGQGERPG